MTATAIHIETKEDSPILPLHRLVMKLRQHGFVIRPEDYVELLKVVETFGQESSEIDAAMLCPLIATSPEEQEKFYNVFAEYRDEEKPKPLPPPGPWDEVDRIGRWLHRSKWWVVGIAVVLLLGTAYRLFFSKKAEALQAVFAYQKTSAGDAALRVGDTLQLDATNVLPPVLANDKTVQFFWDKGHGFAKGKKVDATVLRKQGSQLLQLKIRSENYKLTDSVQQQTINICPAAPLVQLNLNQQSFSLHDVLRVTPVNAGAFHHFAWKVNDKIITPGKDGVLEQKLDSAGEYGISFLGFLSADETETSPCIYRQDLDKIIITDDYYSLRTSYAGRAFSPPVKTQLSPFVYWLLLVPVLAIAIGTWLWWRRKQKPDSKADNETPPSFNGRKPPYETPFENKDLKLTESEAGFRQVYQSFRQKAEDEVVVFNVPQSIRQTIRTGGIPELVFSHTLRYNDYLILIDHSLAKSIQVRLFDYLVRRFDEEAINVERFYYTGRFEKIFNEDVPGGYSLRRLSELYKTHTLIIMGKAHQLIYDAYPVPDKQLFDVLQEWEYKAILTPVPYADWGEKETLLSQQIVLLPTDLAGQLRLLQAIREKALDHRKYLSSLPSYEAETVDFGSLEDLKAYLGDEVLFQWLCATGVYHKLRWEVLIEIGKTICTQYGQGEKMNYTALLKLARISWMADGAFPPGIRLELLKELTPENEIAAREKLLQMMEYAETYFGDDHFFREEKEVQKITSRFVLYAHDPERFNEYADAEAKFKSLLQSGKVWDSPQLAYLNKTDGSCSTLINVNGHAASVDQYFNQKKDDHFAARRRVLWRNAITAASLVLLLGVLYLLKDKLPANSFLIKSIPVATNLTLHITANDSCEGSNSRQIYQGSLRLNNGAEYTVTSDSAGYASLPISANDIGQQGYLELSWNSTGRLHKTSSLASLTSDTLQAVISACQVKPVYTLSFDYNAQERSAEVEGIISFLRQQRVSLTSLTYGDHPLTTALYYRRNASRNGADSIAALLSAAYPAYFNNLKTIPVDTFARELTSNYRLTLNLKPDSLKWVTATLPTSVNEIWHGGTSNRLIAINAPLIYYSTGDKRTFGTYRIVEVQVSNNGIYKVITSAGQQVAVFFLRNIQRNGFELSVCQNRYNSQAEAEAITDANCDHFNAMTLYYESDANKIFLPLDASRRLEPSNAAKWKRVRDRLTQMNADPKQGGHVTINGHLSYNTRYKIQMPAEVTNVSGQQIPIPNSTPFDRSYLMYSFSSSRYFLPEKDTAKEPVINGYENAPNQAVQTTPERRLARINFDEKFQLDPSGQRTLLQIVDYLNSNSRARLRIVIYSYYTRNDNIRQKAEEGAITSYLQKINKSQWTIETKQWEDQPQQQQQVQSKAPPATISNAVDIYGTGFPLNFSTSGSKAD